MIVQNTLQYAEKVTKINKKSVGKIIQILITVSFSLVIFICIVCDIAMFKKLQNKWYASAIVLVIALALDMLINVTLGEPLFDIWDIVSVGIVVFVAALLVWLGSVKFTKSNAQKTKH